MTGFFVFVLFIAVYVLLIWKSGKTCPVLYLFLFTYFVQYILSEYLIYNEYDVLRKEMPITQADYFTYAVPAFCFLFAGIFLFNKDFDMSSLQTRVNSYVATRTGIILLVVSYSFDVLYAIGAPAVGSIQSFSTYLKYLGAFCFLFSNAKFRYPLIALIYLQLLIKALTGGVFIDFFIWSIYLFFFASIRLDLSFKTRFIIMIMAIPVLIVIQGIKEEYRAATWSGKRETGFDTFVDLAAESNAKYGDKSFLEKPGVIRTIGRLSEGWHLSKTIKWVPRNQPFVNGEEMAGDISSSILPRILFSDKKVTHTHEKFFKYTGYKLHGSTSMTIGVLADFYVNFGRTGSFIMLFVFGAIVALMLRYFIKRYVIPDPINAIWIPYMLSYFVRADNDFYMGFNCLVKGFLFFLIINFIRKRIFTPRTT